MAIDFACRCGKKLRARDNMAGSQGRCTSCGQPYLVPRPKKLQDAACDELEVLDDAPAPVPMPLYAGASPQAPRGQYGVPAAGMMHESQRGSAVTGWLAAMAAIGGLAALVIMGVAILSSSVFRNAASGQPTAFQQPQSPPPSTNDSPVREAAEPSAPVDRPAPAAPAVPKPGGVPWVLPVTDGGRSIRIAVTDRNTDHHVFSQNGAFLLVNGQVRELSGDRALGPPLASLGKLPATLALSPDGKLLAEARTNTHVRIWSCETSAQVGTSPLPADRFGGVKFLGFADETSLVVVVSTRRDARVQIWDAPTTRIRQEYSLGPIPSNAEGAISLDGKQLAISRENGISIHEVATGKSVIQLTAPKGDQSFQVNQIAFSRDGSEVAACTTHDHRLLCWTMSGHVMLDKPLAELGASGSFRSANALQWAPDGSGWLLGGTQLIDRKATARRMATARFQAGDHYHCFLDKDRLLVCEGTLQQRSLRDIAVPWTALRQAVAALESDSPALVRPGQAVSLQVQVGNVRFASQEEVKQDLTQTAQQKLEESGVKLAVNQPLIVLIHYEEQDAGTAAVREGLNPAFSDTGQRVSTTGAACSSRSGSAAPRVQPGSVTTPFPCRGRWRGPSTSKACGTLSTRTPRPVCAAR